VWSAVVREQEREMGDHPLFSPSLMSIKENTNLVIYLFSSSLLLLGNKHTDDGENLGNMHNNSFWDIDEKKKKEKQKKPAPKTVLPTRKIKHLSGQRAEAPSAARGERICDASRIRNAISYAGNGQGSPIFCPWQKSQNGQNRWRDKSQVQKNWSKTFFSKQLKKTHTHKKKNIIKIRDL
jgi:hypothetical protein